jgi:hypothetical protein
MQVAPAGEHMSPPVPLWTAAGHSGSEECAQTHWPPSSLVGQEQPHGTAGSDGQELEDASGPATSLLEHPSIHRLRATDSASP